MERMLARMNIEFIRGVAGVEVKRTVRQLPRLYRCEAMCLIGLQVTVMKSFRNKWHSVINDRDRVLVGCSIMKS